MQMLLDNAKRYNTKEMEEITNYDNKLQDEESKFEKLKHYTDKVNEKVKFTLSSAKSDLSRLEFLKKSVKNILIKHLNIDYGS